MKKHSAIDTVCAILAVVVIGGLAFLNLIQPNRPTESVMEKRELAAMPAFTWDSLWSGEYYTGVSAFVSDTFLGREKLVGVSKSMDTLLGYEYSLKGADSFALIGSSDDPNKTVSEVGENQASDLANAIDSLKNRDETEPPETEPVNSAETDKTPDETIKPDEETTPRPTRITSLRLTRKTLNLTVGSGGAVFALAEADGTDQVYVHWSISDGSICTITMNSSGGVDVKGIAPGTCTLTCSDGGDLKATCIITVTEITTAPEGVTNIINETADYLTNGMFILGDAVYTQGYYNDVNAGYYALCASYYKTLFGDSVNVSVLIAPVSSMVIDNPEVLERIPDQKEMLDNMAAKMDPSVNFVDAYSEMYAHRNEYLFYKSDHHWTARGAYYAYCAFAKSLGLTPTPLDGFDQKILSENYQGSMFEYTQDYRVKSFYDTVEAFFSRKKMTMTVNFPSGGVGVYDHCILANYTNYVAFIAGDNPYTVINVPENPQDKNILVLKDSFGNGFVPFLSEHFGNIIVVDIRYYNGNLYDQLKDYGLSDILLLNNIQAANTYNWPTWYLSAVGYVMN